MSLKVYSLGLGMEDPIDRSWYFPAVFDAWKSHSSHQLGASSMLLSACLTVEF